MLPKQFPRGWQIVTLGDIARRDGYGLVDGPFGSSLPASDYVPFGIPVIRGSNLSLGGERFIADKFVFISPQTAKRLGRSIAEPDDIIFTKKGTLGQTGIVPHSLPYKQYLTSSNQMKLSVEKDRAFPLFVYYYVSSPASREKIIRDSEATGVPKTNLLYLRTFPILLPPLPEQRAISEVLGALDDKIELNRQMNATLTAMIWTIFRSWFIDFDPIYAKANGQKPKRIDVDTARLFPSAFHRNTPEGWKVSQFRDFLTPINNRIGNEDAPEYSATVNGISLRDENFNKSLSKSKEKNKKVIKNNLVFGLSRRTLNFGVMKEDIGSVSPVYEIFDIDPNVYLPELLEMYIRLKMDEHIDILKPAAREGQSIDRNYLLSKSILIPDMKLQKHYQEYCTPFRDKVTRNEKESRTLTSLRDTLLPKLMRGEVRVKEV